MLVRVNINKLNNLSIYLLIKNRFIYKFIYLDFWKRRNGRLVAAPPFLEEVHGGAAHAGGEGGGGEGALGTSTSA